MTDEQATALLAYVVSAFPGAQTTPATMAIYLEHLVPLPYERTERAVRELVMTHHYPSLPTIAELLEAAGIVDDEGRAQLREAMAAQRPLVRDVMSPTGWAVGEARLTPEANNALTERKALPGPVVSAEKQGWMRAKLAALASGLRGAVAE